MRLKEHFEDAAKTDAIVEAKQYVKLVAAKTELDDEKV